MRLLVGSRIGVRSPKPEVSAIYYLPQCWEPNSGHLQEQYTVLTAEPSPWALVQTIFKCGFWGLNSGPLRTSSPAIIPIFNKDVLGQTPNTT